jgi:hypothetical protein
MTNNIDWENTGDQPWPPAPIYPLASNIPNGVCDCSCHGCMCHKVDLKTILQRLTKLENELAIFRHRIENER